MLPHYINKFIFIFSIKSCFIILLCISRFFFIIYGLNLFLRNCLISNKINPFNVRDVVVPFLIVNNADLIQIADRPAISFIHQVITDVHWFCSHYQKYNICNFREIGSVENARHNGILVVSRFNCCRILSEYSD